MDEGSPVMDEGISTVLSVRIVGLWMWNINWKR